jgi:HK97 family phage major capsid protein
MIDGAPLGFVTNWQAFGHALRTPKVAGYPVFLAEYAENTPVAQGANAGRMLRMPVHLSQNAPSNLTKGSGTALSAMIFGNWSDALLGEWGILDILVDPYTLSNTGAIRIRALMTVDFNLRYASAFAALKDIVTT